MYTIDTYTCLFKEDGDRYASLALGVNYNNDEEKNKLIEQLKADATKEGIDNLIVQEVSLEDYNNLLGNNEDNQIYIRKDDGIFIPKPPYVPTAEEQQQMDLSKLDADYGAQLDDLKDQIIVASTVDQDEEYAQELREERQALQEEYIQKRSEL